MPLLLKGLGAFGRHKMKSFVELVDSAVVNLQGAGDNESVNRTSLFLPLLILGLSSGAAFSQAKPTAVRSISPSAFVLVGGSRTGLGANGTPTFFDSGKNLLVTAGLDVGFYSFGHYMVGAEVRGSFPVNSGKFVGERAILGGARLSYESNKPIRPYIDGLAGRGQMDYQNGGLVQGNLLYKQTAGGVFGGGGGVEWDLLRQISLKGDVQLQRWSTPVVSRGFVWSGQVSVGAAYRFGAGAGPH
jgi:hypothetical protein